MNRKQLLKLPSLPLTETYSKTYKGKNSLSYDAELYLDKTLSLVRLDNNLTDIKYDEESYAYRTTSFSNKISQDLKRFIDFVSEVKNLINFEPSHLIEIGGNDLTLSKFIYSDYEKITVIDPLAPSNFKDKDFPKLESINACDYEINIQDYASTNTLVISRHTIEHIVNPLDHFKRLSKSLNSNTVYVYEFPDFRQLINSLRFDAIFHQHISYFDIYSFIGSIEKYGFKIISLRLNTLGSCGGSTQIAFTKKEINNRFSFKEIESNSYSYLNENELTDLFHKSYATYRAICVRTEEHINQYPFKVYGYGAALMLPTFFYHSRISPDLLEYIFDDDPAKDGLTYSNIPLTIKNPNTNELKNMVWSCLITSTEASRPIIKNVLNYKPKFIYSLLSIN